LSLNRITQIVAGNEITRLSDSWRGTDKPPIPHAKKPLAHKKECALLPPLDESITAQHDQFVKQKMDNIQKEQNFLVSEIAYIRLVFRSSTGKLKNPHFGDHLTGSPVNLDSGIKRGTPFSNNAIVAAHKMWCFQ